MTDTTRTPIDASTSVNDVLAQLPAAASALHDRGIDTCCGGVLPLAEACSAAGADLEPLLSELRGLAADGA
jgi:regulator of cell morphogenesis and NO signaling